MSKPVDAVRVLSANNYTKWRWRSFKRLFSKVLFLSSGYFPPLPPPPKKAHLIIFHYSIFVNSAKLKSFQYRECLLYEIGKETGIMKLTVGVIQGHFRSWLACGRNTAGNPFILSGVITFRPGLLVVYLPGDYLFAFSLANLVCNLHLFHYIALQVAKLKQSGSLHNLCWSGRILDGFMKCNLVNNEEGWASRVFSCIWVM